MPAAAAVVETKRAAAPDTRAAELQVTVPLPLLSLLARRPLARVSVSRSCLNALDVSPFQAVVGGPAFEAAKDELVGAVGAFVNATGASFTLVFKDPAVSSHLALHRP